MSRALLPLIAGAALSLALLASGEPPAGPKHPAPAEVERLIRQLGSDSFSEREAAAKALEAIGAPALEALREAARGEDLERRLRARRLVEMLEARLYRELRRFRGHRGTVYGVACSPDGRRALSCGGDTTLRLWDVETGEELRRFKGHRGGVYAVAFSRDGKRVLSGSADQTLWLWDADTGEPLRRFTGHEHAVTGVAFSADGKRALSGSADTPIRQWDLQTGKELAAPRARPAASPSPLLTPA